MKDDERVQRLVTVLSVGPVTSGTLVALIDDIGRLPSGGFARTYEQVADYWERDRIQGFSILGGLALLGLAMSAWGGVGLRKASP